MRPFKTLYLATRDYLYEWRMSSCFILALAAILGPMLVLFGLKFGIVSGMLEQLIEDPRNREIRPVGSSRYQLPWIEEMKNRPDVAFVVPKTRSLAATIRIRTRNQSSRILSAEVLPSGPGDPLLSDLQEPPEGLHRVTLSQSAAEKLRVSAGEIIEGSITRRYLGNRERVRLDLTVAAIAPISAYSRDGLFASVKLADALEEYRDGHAVDALNWHGSTVDGPRTYPSFRLYTQSIYQVSALRDEFIKHGIDVRTRAKDIELVQKIDRNLSAMYWAIAIIGLVGFSLSLGASLWANVDRKRKELSVLRLVGFHTGDIVWFPIIQAFYTAIFGWLLAIAIFFIAAWGINDLMPLPLEEHQAVCKLLPEHLIIALVIVLAAAVLSSALAGFRSARIEPSEGLREI